MAGKQKLLFYWASIRLYLWKVFSDKQNLIRFSVAAVAIIVASQLMQAITIASFWVAIVLILITIVLLVSAQPALTYLKIPYSIVSFGLFLWIANALILLALDWMLWYLETSTWWWVFLYALVQAIINSMIEILIREE